jgi:hypothetical protein
MTERPDDVLVQIGQDTSFHGSSCRKHDFACRSADIGEEDNRNVTFRLAGNADIPVREHVLKWPRSWAAQFSAIRLSLN